MNTYLRIRMTTFQNIDGFLLRRHEFNPNLPEHFEHLHVAPGWWMKVSTVDLFAQSAIALMSEETLKSSVSQ